MAVGDEDLLQGFDDIIAKRIVDGERGLNRVSDGLKSKRLDALVVGPTSPPGSLHPSRAGAEGGSF